MLYLLRFFNLAARYHLVAFMTSLILATVPLPAAADNDADFATEPEFVPGETRQEGTRLLRDWREPVSGIKLFRIESGYPEPVLRTINSALERQHRDRVAEWMACEGDGGGSGVEMSEARSVYLSDDFVSYAWFSSWSCAGAAHPDFGSQGFTFDARTGRELALEDLLYFGQTPVPEPDTPAFYTYRNAVFAPQVIALFTSLYSADMAGAEGEAAEGQCDYADPSVWAHPSWHLTGKGLYLGAYFGRASRPCDEPDWSFVPWSHLAPPKAAPATPDALRFGDAEFTGGDVAGIVLDFDQGGFPVLDIALQPEAADRLHAETIRLLNTDVTFRLGSTTLIAARLVEPIAGGRLRISGRFSLAETRELAGRIICALQLSPGQYDPPGLSASLPCLLAKVEPRT